MKFELLPKNKINSLPKNPGVYALKRGKKFLYIGKAASLRERVKNHFQRPGFRDNLFINQVSKIGYIKTNSEIGALILEASLIKKYLPKYNVIWKDDKNYFFVAVTKDYNPPSPPHQNLVWGQATLPALSTKGLSPDFPRIFITHQTKLKANYVGPFVDGKSLKQALKVLRKVFPYRSCRRIPKRPCLWYQLGKCPAPCLLKSRLGKELPVARLRIKRACQENAKNLTKILQGKKKKVLQNLKQAMKKQVKLQKFEEAAKIRDQIAGLEKILAHARILDQEPVYVITRPWYSYYVWKRIEEGFKKNLKTKRRIQRIEAYDVSNIQGQQATGAMVTFIKGKPEKKFYRLFKIKLLTKPNDIAMLKEILKRRFKHPEWGWPDLILVDGGKAQLNAVLECLKRSFKQVGVVALAKKGNKLYIKGERRAILLKTLPREIFNLILQLRDEAHRFALKYHRKLRKKQIIE